MYIDIHFRFLTSSSVYVAAWATWAWQLRHIYIYICFCIYTYMYTYRVFASASISCDPTWSTQSALSGSHELKCTTRPTFRAQGLTQPLSNSSSNSNSISPREGPSTKYLRTLVPKTIMGMVWGIRVLRYWGPWSHSNSRWSMLQWHLEVVVILACKRQC